MECRFCRNMFINKYKLERHQRTAQFCLELQKADVKERTCERCDKVYSSERELKVHKCSVVQQDIDLIIKLQRRIDLLEEKVEKLSAKNDIHQALIPLTEDFIRNTTSNLSLEEHIKLGARGYADFACEYVFVNTLICSDVSRRHFKYKTIDGEIADDYHLLKVVPLFFSAIEKTNTEIINTYKTEKLSEIDSSDLEEYEHEQFSNILSHKTEIKDAIKGLRTKFVDRFVKSVALMTKS